MKPTKMAGLAMITLLGFMLGSAQGVAAQTANPQPNPTAQPKVIGIL
jgi:hypothetical protein